MFRISGWITSPLELRLKIRCSRSSSAPRRAAARAAASPVAALYAARPRMGVTDSWNDEWVAAGRGSQFQPPSGHCARSSVCTSERTRSSSARPSREHTNSALPSIEAWRRSRPETTQTRDGALIQPSTPSTARAPSVCPRGRPSSTIDTSRQCAPVHFRLGWPPKEPSGCWLVKRPVIMRFRQESSGSMCWIIRHWSGGTRYSRPPHQAEPARSQRLKSSHAAHSAR